jgi:hypothetical protein
LNSELSLGHHEKITTSDVTSALMRTPDAGGEKADVDAGRSAIRGNADAASSAGLVRFVPILLI